MTLADRLWALIEPSLQPGQPRSPQRFHYRLVPGAPPVLHQAEGLFVALEAISLRDAFTAYSSAERWGALVPAPTTPAGHTIRALLYTAQCTAGERIAMALPDAPRDDVTRKFDVIRGGRSC